MLPLPEQGTAGNDESKVLDGTRRTEKESQQLITLEQSCRNIDA